MVQEYTAFHQIPISDMFRICEESIRRRGEKNWPDSSPQRQLENAQEAFREDVRAAFSENPGTRVLLAGESGYPGCCARVEPYEDGFLLSNLETAPDLRRRGLASELICAVHGKLYSHVARSNRASLALHTACGFTVVRQTARLLDGSVTSRYLTLCRESG